MPETIERIKKDVADKGIMFFDEIDLSSNPSSVVALWEELQSLVVTAQRFCKTNPIAAAQYEGR